MSLDFETPRFNELNEGWNLPKPPLKGHYNGRIGPANQKKVFDAIGPGMRTNEQIADDTNIGRKMVSEYLRRLIKARKVYIAGAAPATGRGTPPLVYAQGDMPDAVAPRLRNRTKVVAVPDETRRVEIVRVPIGPQSWCSALFAVPVVF